MQHPVDRIGPGDTYMLGQVEPTLKRAVCDAAVQIGARLVFLSLAGRNDQRLLAHFDRQFVFTKAGHSD